MEVLGVGLAVRISGRALSAVQFGLLAKLSCREGSKTCVRVPALPVTHLLVTSVSRL